MKNYNRAKLAYNLALYSLTSIITCFFFSSPFWFPSITNYHFTSPNIISSCFNAKCLFVMGNIIVIILVGESKLKQSSTLNIYDEYVARSQRRYYKETVDGSVKTEEKIHKKLEMKINKGEERRGMRSCKSEVWGENEMVKTDKTKIKLRMASSKSAVWSESETEKIEKAKGKKEEQCSRTSTNDEEKKMGMRSSKSAVWSESERVKMERDKGKKEEQSSKINIIDREEKKKGILRGSSSSAVWGESARGKDKGMKKEEHDEEMKMGTKSCRSEVWSESEIGRMRKTHVAKEEQQIDVLNKRVEDFIARVNRQRLLEATIYS